MPLQIRRRYRSPLLILTWRLSGRVGTRTKVSHQKYHKPGTSPIVCISPHAGSMVSVTQVSVILVETTRRASNFRAFFFILGILLSLIVSSESSQFVSINIQIWGNSINIQVGKIARLETLSFNEIGRASCRERVS